MDQQLKERLVGAAVLVALTAIFVPMVLDGPSPPATPAPATLAPAPVDGSTFGYDLNAPLPGSPATTAASAPSTAAAPSAAVAAVASPSAQPSVSTAAPVVTTPTPAPTVAAAAKPKAAAPAPAPAPKPSTPAASGGAWAAQVGSFSKEATAQAIAADLKHRGFKAFVMPHKEDGKTLYRVRVGPVATREAADALGRKITQQTGQAARPVRHP